MSADSPRTKGKKNTALDVAEGGLYARGSKRSPSGILVGDSTMSAALKNKYIVRSRHGILGQDRFVPVNKDEAKMMVKKPIVHDSGPPINNDEKDM